MNEDGLKGRLKDEISPKDKRILNAMRANPQMNPKEIREYLDISEEVYLNTMSKPCVKEELKAICQDMLDLSQITRTQNVIDASGDSIQGSKLAAELAGEIGKIINIQDLYAL